MKTKPNPQAYPDERKEKTPDLRWGLRCGLRWGLLIGAVPESGRLGSGAPSAAAAAESSATSASGALAFFAARWARVLKPEQKTELASIEAQDKN